MENPKIESLCKILYQERLNGFLDRTVIGGLDQFLKLWEFDLKTVVSNFKSYSSLNPSQRRAWANAILNKCSNNFTTDTNTEKVTSTRKVSTPDDTETDIASLYDDVRLLKGVSKDTYLKLGRLGIKTIGDLTYFFPRKHHNYGNIRKVVELRPDEEQTLICTVLKTSHVGPNQRKRSTEAVLGDETGKVRAVWFNQPWMTKTLKRGLRLVISGKVTIFRSQVVFESPEYEFYRKNDSLLHTGRLVPVYPSTHRLSQRILRKLIKQTLDIALPQVTDFLSNDLKYRLQLRDLPSSITQIHFPHSMSGWESAKRRLSFDELFLIQLAVLKRKYKWQEKGKGISLVETKSFLRTFNDSIPFTLTATQATALDEILSDLRSDKPMNRLLQGDVGSGKTIVAIGALLLAKFNNYQSALMVPTEVLAEQHFISITNLLNDGKATTESDNVISLEINGFDAPIKIGLLTGSLNRKNKDGIHKLIEAGDIDVIIGTHALIQSSVRIPKLVLAIVDEQHRFGVMQRASLEQKGIRPHMLSMSATPIPRSLTLTLHGDQDISVISELPPGRPHIRTRWIESNKRDSAYHLILREINSGRQAFIVCPFIEESEIIQTKAAIKEHQRLSETVFPNHNLGLLHGRMPWRDKENVMDQFKNQELDILVTTPVIEVGIDVPNATVMLIDGADRFGLAQLHQFRGRVGRGEHPSYCLLLSDVGGNEARERLRIIERISDGFKLAEEDLRIRGPGDYIGTRQSGIPELKIADIADYELLSIARREAGKVLQDDPNLSNPNNRPLLERLQSLSDNSWI